MPELSAMLLGVNPPQSPRLKIAPSVPVKAWGEPRQDEKSSSAMRKILLTSSDTQILTLSEQANEIYRNIFVHRYTKHGSDNKLQN